MCTCTLNVNVIIGTNHGLKLNPQNYTTKGTGAQSVEKQGISGLDACMLCVLQKSCSAPIESKTLTTSCCQKSEGGQSLVCQFSNVLLFYFLSSCWISAFMQKQLRIWKVRRWNILALAVSKFCRDSVEVYIFNYRYASIYIYKLYKYVQRKKANTVCSHPKNKVLYFLINGSVGCFY